MATTTAPALRVGTFALREQPVLDAGAVTLHPWRRDDADAVVAAYRDPAIRHWHARTMTLAEALTWVAHWADRWAADSGAGWAIRTADDVVGQVSVRQVDLHEARIELSYWVAPAFRGRGVAPAALSTVTEWAFRLGVHRAQLDHSTRNPASCRVASKAGFAAEGTAVGRGLHADGWHDMHLHARLAPDEARTGGAPQG